MEKQDFLKMFAECVKDGSISFKVQIGERLVGGEYGYMQKSATTIITFGEEEIECSITDLHI